MGIGQRVANWSIRGAERRPSETGAGPSAGPMPREGVGWKLDLCHSEASHKARLLFPHL